MIYVTGYSGHIGQMLLKRGCLPLDCDVTSPKSIRTAITKAKDIHLIVHLASRSDPVWCEKKENIDEVINVNLHGTFNVCSAAMDEKIGVALLSTDHVFDGRRGPYRETYTKIVPVNVYGMSKFAAEGVVQSFTNAKTVRTSFLFDNDRLQRCGFLPFDQPTFMKRSFMHYEHFVRAFMVYLDKFYAMPNLLHIAGSQTVSWYKFIKDANEILGYSYSIRPRRSELINTDFVSRPYKAGLNTSLGKKLGIPQYSYIDGIRWTVHENLNSDPVL